MTVIHMETKTGSVAPEPEKDGSVSRERYKAAASALRAHKDSTVGVTWKDLATQIGGEYSDTTLSLFSNEKYPRENARRVTEAVEEFLGLVAERRKLVTNTAYVATSVSRRLLGLLKQVVLLTKIGVAAAESGTGKTKTLQHYWSEHPRSIYIKANALFASRSATSWPLMLKLATAVGLTAVGKNKQAGAYEAIVAGLRNTSRLVIIDEAQFLQNDSLDLIRCIHEEANIPVVLAGNESLYERGPGGYGNSAAFVQFQSRCLRTRFGTGDIKAADVEAIAEQLVGVDVARDAASLLLDQARAAGGFRRLVTLLQIAQTLRDGNGAVRKTHVVRAIEDAGTWGGAQ